jgi:hypothetical protein
MKEPESRNAAPGGLRLIAYLAEIGWFLATCIGMIFPTIRARAR